MEILFGGDLIEVETAEFVAELNSFLGTHFPIAQTVALCTHDQDGKIRTMLAKLSKYVDVKRIGKEIEMYLFPETLQFCDTRFVNSKSQNLSFEKVLNELFQFSNFAEDPFTSTIELVSGGLSSLSTDFAAEDPAPPPPVTGEVPTPPEGVVHTVTLPEGLDCVRSSCEKP